MSSCKIAHWSLFPQTAFAFKLDIVTPVSIPVDGKNYSVVCKLSVPPEARGTVTMKWFGPSNNLTAINNVTLFNIGGATFTFDLMFSPIHTRDAGWYSCGITYGLYPVSSAKKLKISVESEYLMSILWCINMYLMLCINNYPFL